MKAWKQLGLQRGGHVECRDRFWPSDRMRNITMPAALLSDQN
uniref:Uncharacterized protein n=1 Tax=Physcomitrium patens TaxID=3218 RepID=A0A7I4BLU1_PHYPA